MLFSKLFLVFFAVAAATSRPWQFFMDIPENLKHVSMKEYFHSTPMLYDEFLRTRPKVSTEKKWGFKEIYSGEVNRFLKSAGLRILGFIFKRSISFQTYFRAPPLRRPTSETETVEVYLIFSYDPAMEFHWDSSLIGAHFQKVETIVETESLYRNKYKVVCQPGSVFPIRLTMLNVKRNMRFNLQWATPWDQDLWMPLSPQLVKIGPAQIVEAIPCHIKGLSPVTWDLGTSHSTVELSRFIPLPTVRLNAIDFHRSDSFLLDGYFRPSQENTRFVLSSISPALVVVHTAALMAHRWYPIYVLRSRRGYASKVVMKLEPNVYHRISVWSAMSSSNVFDFLLLSYNLENEFAGSNVTFLNPEYDGDMPKAKTHEVGIGPDSVPECPAPRPGLKSTIRAIDPLGKRNDTNTGNDAGLPAVESWPDPDYDLDGFLNRFVEESGTGSADESV